MDSQIILPPNESIAFGPDSGLSCREAKSNPVALNKGNVYLSGRSRSSVNLLNLDISIGDTSWRIEGATSPIGNTYNDVRYLQAYASKIESVINESEGEFSAEIDPENPASVKIYSPAGDEQNNFEMKIDYRDPTALHNQIGSTTKPYAYPGVDVLELDQNNEETTTVCDGR